MYTYKATVYNVYDGDTFKAEVDLGFHVNCKLTFRLGRVNTPELRGGTVETKMEGIKARDRVRNLILNKEVTIKTEKTGKFGRWIAEVFLPGGENLSDLLVTESLGVYLEYKS